MRCRIKDLLSPFNYNPHLQRPKNLAKLLAKQTEAQQRRALRTPDERNDGVGNQQETTTSILKT
jgi:hypothetical protein